MQRAKIKNKGLRQGEIKILKALESGAKTNKEIGDATGFSHQPTLLSRYLKSLQKHGLVTRDVDTRKYRADKISVEKLFYHDLLEFLSEQVGIDLNTVKEELKPIITNPLWLSVTDQKATAFRKELKKTLENPQNNEVLNKVWRIVADAWENYILAHREPKEREIIIKYKQSLLEAYRLMVKKRSMKEIQELAFATAAKNLRREFPELENIPKEAVYIEAIRELRQLEEAHDTIGSALVSDLEDLFSQMEIEEKLGNVGDSDNSKEEQRLFEIAEFMINKGNRRIYERFRKSLENPPQTLVVFPVLGFSGYLKELEGLYPEKAVEAKKEMLEKQEEAWRDFAEKLKKRLKH
jgi:hypothetical protein